MHETSIVNSIFKTLEMEFDKEKLDRLNAIHVRVGVLSNVEPRLLHNAYSAFHLSNPSYSCVDLHIESLGIKIECEHCGHITDVENYRFLCEKCNIPSKNIIQGEEMLIHKVEFKD